MSFREIEYKFVVDRFFDLEALRGAVRELGPRKTTIVSVRDVYYHLDALPEHVYRHRYDEELQQLTVKSLADDSLDRLEVNLDLGHHQGDQRARVEAFLAPFGIRWKETIHKEIEVYYFDDCEIVYYLARAAEREIRCVEFEALGTEDVESARKILDRYAHPMGFDASLRETRSLVQMFFPERF